MRNLGKGTTKDLDQFHKTVRVIYNLNGNKLACFFKLSDHSCQILLINAGTYLNGVQPCLQILD
jgi:hypothetical protein